MAALTVFTDRTAFLAAAGGTPVNETFSTPQAFVSGNNFYNGVNYFIAGSPGSNSVSGGVLNGDEFTSTSVDYIFPTPVKAWGSDFTGAFTAQGLNFTINGETVSLNAALGNPGTGFFGVVSDTSFTTVDVFSPAPPNELYSSDNLTYVPVPEPTGVALAIAAVGLPALRRRRR
jgi:MYXO-CTERM domain-containing protein